MKLWLRILLAIATLIAAAEFFAAWRRADTSPPPTTLLAGHDYFQRHIAPSLPLAQSWSFPIMPPLGEGAYLLRSFREQSSLGESWAPTPGQQTSDATHLDIHAMTDGMVLLATDLGPAWGHVIILLHRMEDGSLLESLYAGLASIDVHPGQTVRSGSTIGRIDSSPDAHLYWEIRSPPLLGLGPAENEDAEGWLPPSRWLLQEIENSQSTAFDRAAP